MDDFLPHHITITQNVGIDNFCSIKLKRTGKIIPTKF
jgi:hypothetical protein